MKLKKIVLICDSCNKEINITPVSEVCPHCEHTLNHEIM